MTQPLMESPDPCFPLIVIDSLCRWFFYKCRCGVDIGVSLTGNVAPLLLFTCSSQAGQGHISSLQIPLHPASSYSGSCPAWAALVRACSGHSRGPGRVSPGWPLPQRSKSGAATHRVASTDGSSHIFQQYTSVLKKETEAQRDHVVSPKL